MPSVHFWVSGPSALTPNVRKSKPCTGWPSMMWFRNKCPILKQIFMVSKENWEANIGWYHINEHQHTLYKNINSPKKKRNSKLFLLSIQGGKITYVSDVLRLTVVDWIMATKRYKILISRTCKFIFWEKGCLHVTKLRILRWDYPGVSSGP